MIKPKTDNQQKKSPQQRFLFVIGALFFVLYLAMGLTVIFWDDFPIRMQTPYRIALGVILIVYAGFRFFRMLK